MEKVSLRQKAKGRIKKDWVNYRSGILMSGALLVVLSLLGQGVCPLSNLWGLPCPGCGMTRSILLLLTGHWQESFEMHPFAPVWILFVLAVAVERYLFGRNGSWKKLALVLLLAGMLLNYIYHMVTVFPSVEPYTYYPGNLTERMLPGYGEWVKYFIDGQSQVVI